MAILYTYSHPACYIKIVLHVNIALIGIEFNYGKIATAGIFLRAQLASVGLETKSHGSKSKSHPLSIASRLQADGLVGQQISLGTGRAEAG